MKKRIFGFLIAICMTLAIVSVVTPKTYATTVTVSGGRETVTFDGGNLSQFSLYTEFERYPYVADGKLYMWSLAEQKAVYKDKNYSDVEVNVDIGTINPGGKIDAGVLVQCTSCANGAGEMSCWGVNLEYSGGVNFIKLHRWQNNAWAGVSYEKSGVILNQVNHLRIVVKSGVLYVYLNNSATEEFSYNIGTTAGKVGLRCWYAPNYFDNFTVTGAASATDTIELMSCISRANGFNQNLLTASSKSALSTALSNANTAKNSSDQTTIDSAAAALKTACDNAMYKHTYSELTSLISTANAITNNGQYTGNSYNALRGVITFASALTSSASEDTIAYWYMRLEMRINGLIAYVKEG